MSEPMSSVEIEDVLSSIRRLVSDDLRPQTRTPRDTPPPAPPAAPLAEKLVLTPALRIVPEPAPAPDRALAAQDPEGGTFHSIRAAVEEARFVSVEEDDAVDGATASLAPAQDPADYDDDGAAAPLDIAAAIPDGVFDRAEAPAEPEAMAQQPDPWADEAEAAIRAELEQETVTEAYARFLDEPEDNAFDEAAMRDLVRDIIREELQGTLGERITRNVRKLVRAEIARALAVRDFD